MKKLFKKSYHLILGILLIISIIITPTLLILPAASQKHADLDVIPLDQPNDKRSEFAEEIEEFGIPQSSKVINPVPLTSLPDNPTATVAYNIATGIETLTPSPDPLSEISSSRRIEPYEGLIATDSELYQSIYEDYPFDTQPESVIGGDDRILVRSFSSTTSYPWRTICKLYTFHPGGGVAVGSGWFTDSYHVVTAGHCVYLHDELGWPYDAWASQIVVVPGMDDSYAPYTKAYATYLRSYTGWTSSISHEHDWAMITLDREIGATTGWMGRQTADPSDPIYTGTLNSGGYPHDLDVGMNMYYDDDLGDYATANNHWYYIDTAGGQSGMPIWRLESGNRYVLTVHAYGVYGSYDTNHGTRLNQDKYDRIFTWQSADTAPTAQADLIDRGQRYCEEWEPWPANWGNHYGTFSPSLVGSPLLSGHTSFTVGCQVSNFGAAASGDFDVSFYASTNTIISTGDYLIGTVRVTSIGAWSSRTASWTGTFPSGVPTGLYYIGWIIDSGSEVSEMSEANNLGVITTSQLEVDATAPTNPTSHTANPAVDVWSNDNTIYVSWSGATDANGIAGYGLFWSHGPGLPSTVIDTTYSYTTSSMLSDGFWYLNIRSCDNAGNWNSGYYTVGPFKIDTIAPTNPISFVSTPLVNIWTNDNTIYVEWSESSDGSGSGVDGYGLYWSTNPTGIPSTIIDTVDNFTTSSALIDGDSWYLHIITADLAGNWNMTVYHIGPFKVDTGPPTTSSTLTGTLGTNNWYLSLVNITLSRSDTYSGILSTMYNINGSGWQLYTGKFNITDDGIYTIEFYSEDNAGNIESTQSLQIKIDKAVPDTSLNAEGTSTGGWFSINTNISFIVTDATSGLYNITYRIDGGTWQLYTSFFWITSEGEHTIEYYSIDLAGNVELIKSSIIRIDKSVPTWNQTPENQVIAFGISFRYDLNASDTLSGISSWSINDTTHFSISNQGIITSVDPLPAGIYGLQVTVTDVAGHELTASFTVEQQAQPLIPGFPLPAILLGTATALGIGLILRHRHQPRKP